MKKYQKINELIELWEQFEGEEKNTSFYNFSLWLNNHSIKEDKDEQPKEAEEEEEQLVEIPVMPEEKYLKYYEHIQLDGRVSALINRFGRFSHFYVKKIFKDQPISTILEFSFLAGINTMQSPKKSELISMNIVEVTTGSEILKRLKNGGLIDETDDTEDRRSKRLSLTPKGNEVVIECRKKLMELGALVMGNLEEKEKLSLLDTLIYLNNYHNKIYFEQFDLSIEEIIEKNVFGK